MCRAAPNGTASFECCGVAQINLNYSVTVTLHNGIQAQSRLTSGFRTRPGPFCDAFEDECSVLVHLATTSLAMQVCHEDLAARLIGRQSHRN